MTGATRLPADAAQVLRTWVAPDAEQEELRLTFLAHLLDHPDGTWRSCAEGHVTTSGLVLDDARERTLLTLHPKVNRWLQLGGHCEPTDASLAGAAAREAWEESGIPALASTSGPVRLDRHLVPCWRPGSSVAHLDVQYVFTAPPGAREHISLESLDLRWWPVGALPDDADDALRALVAAAVAPASAAQSLGSSVGSSLGSSVWSADSAAPSPAMPEPKAAPSR